MRYMTTCCCGCCTVKTGTQALSIIALIRDLIIVIALSATTAAVATAQEGIRESYSGTEYLQPDHDRAVQIALSMAMGIMVAVIVVFALHIVVAALCIHGAFNDRRYFILPYLILEGIAVAVGVIGFIFGIVGVASTSQSQPGSIAAYVVSALVVLTLEAYFFFVVLSFYKNLRYQAAGITEGVAYTRSP